MYDAKKEQMDRLDRIKGTLYGVAVGDCLGTPVEFMNPQDIERRYGTVTEIKGGGWLGAPVGEGTDDTAMTLAVAEGLMRTGPLDDPVEKIGHEFIKWFYGDPIGAGAACARSIVFASKNGQVRTPKRSTWFRAAQMAHDAMGGKSGGNGSLMRTAPVALFITKIPCRDQLAIDVSSMTHYDPDAALACVRYCAMIGELVCGLTLSSTIDRGTLNTEYRQAVMDKRFAPYPGGYVKDSFKTALWGIANSHTFKDALIKVVNLGGDADTTGAIVGGLAGAAYGYSAIPPQWIAALDDDLKKRLDDCAVAAGKIWKCWG